MLRTRRFDRQVMSGFYIPLPGEHTQMRRAEMSELLAKISNGQHAADKAKARRKSVMGSAWPRAASGHYVARRCTQCTVRDGKHEAGCPIEYRKRNLRK